MTSLRLEDDLSHGLNCKGIKVVLLDGGGLLKEGSLLEAVGD